MKNKFKLLFGLVIIAVLFSCGSPKSKLLKAEQKEIENSIHAYYEFARERGWVELPNNTSIEANISFDTFAELLKMNSKKDLSALEGVGLGFYHNISKKTAEQELELSLTKEDKALPVMNLAMTKEKLTASLPFTPDNLTFFVNINDAEDALGNKGELAELISIYKNVIESAYKQPTEKEIIYMAQQILKDYYSFIEVEEKDGYYTYSVSKEKSKEIMLKMQEKIVKMIQTAYPIYATDQYTKAFNKFSEAIKKSEGVAYTAKKKVSGKKVVEGIVTFESETNEPFQIISKASDTEKSTVGKIDTKDMNFELSSIKTINGDTSKIVFEMFMNEKKTGQLVDVSFDVEKTAEKLSFNADYVLHIDKAPVSFNINYNDKKQDDKIKYDLLCTINGPNKARGKNFNMDLKSDGFYQKTNDSLIFDGRLNLASSNKKVAGKNVAMSFFYKINNSQLRQLEFAGEDAQTNVLKADQRELAMTLQNSLMQLVPELEKIGIDQATLSNLK